MLRDNLILSRICKKEELAKGVYKLTFETDTCTFERPGQYAIVVIDGIPRACQVCDFDSNRFTIIADTHYEEGVTLSQLEYGHEVMTATGLGNGFDLDAISDDVVLVADRLGIPEMLVLARTLLTRGIHFKVVLGYPSKEEMFMLDSFRNICSELEILTLDGSNGREGGAHDGIIKADYVCASGSADMLARLAAKSCDGQFSFSSWMVTGRVTRSTILGITGDTLSVEAGPVFKKDEINWNEL